MFIFVFLFTLFMIIASWAAVIITFIAFWQTHKKAGLPGWSGIVPYYNYFARAEKLNMKESFWKAIKYIAIEIGVSIVGGFAAFIVTLLVVAGSVATVGIMGATDIAAETGLLLTGGVAILVAIIGVIIIIACCILLVLAIIEFVKIDIQFVKNFGKEKSFVLGMYFLPFIFYPMLAWGDVKWNAPDTAVVDAEVIK